MIGDVLQGEAVPLLGDFPLVERSLYKFGSISGQASRVSFPMVLEMLVKES